MFNSPALTWPPMLLVLAVLSAAYVVAVVYVLREKRAARAATATTAPPPLPQLPADDRPPLAAVGWPPQGAGFTPYVDEGAAALDAFLAEGYAP